VGTAATRDVQRRLESLAAVAVGVGAYAEGVWLVRYGATSWRTIAEFAFADGSNAADAAVDPPHA
jgi:hypothetical protein